MQALPPLQPHVGSPSNGSITRVPSNSSRGTAVRVLPIIMAAGVLLSTFLQLWGWLSQIHAIDPLQSKAVVSVRAALHARSNGSSGASSGSNNRQWVQISAPLRPTQIPLVATPTALPFPSPAHIGAAASAQDPGTAGTDGSVSITYLKQQQQRKQVAPKPRISVAHTADAISFTNIISSRTVPPHQRYVAPSPFEHASVHPSSSTSPSVGLPPKRHHGSQAKTGGASTSSQAAAAAGTTEGSSASLLQLTQAYEESLEDLSMALKLSKTKADEAAALREQLLQAYRQNGRKDNTTTSSSRKQTQAQQAQYPQQQLTRRTTADLAVTKPASRAEAAKGATADAAQGRHSSLFLRSWCSRGSGKHIKVFIGVYTAFNTPGAELQYNYAARRAALRESWFPRSKAALAALESEHGVVVRFVIGSSDDAAEEAALLQEEREHGDFMRLPVKEDSRLLPNKTRTFFKMVTDEWEPDWVVKMDDSVYLNIPRLLEAVRQWGTMGAQYVGCMRHGSVYTAPGSRWYEPANMLVGPTYWMHAHGTIYAIDGRTASCAIGAAFDTLRLLAYEDTSVGLWMLASDVVHFEDMRLCLPVCTKASVAVQRRECAGLCNPLEDLKSLHANSNCSAPPEGHLLYHKSSPEHAAFESMWVE